MIVDSYNYIIWTILYIDVKMIHLHICFTFDHGHGSIVDWLICVVQTVQKWNCIDRTISLEYLFRFFFFQKSTFIALTLKYRKYFCVLIVFPTQDYFQIEFYSYERKEQKHLFVRHDVTYVQCYRYFLIKEICFIFI